MAGQVERGSALVLTGLVALGLLVPAEASHSPFHGGLCIYGADEPYCLVGNPSNPPQASGMFLIAFKILPSGLAPGGSYCNATVSSVNPSINVIGTRTSDASFVACARADPSVRFVQNDYWSRTFDLIPTNETYSGSQAPPAYVPNDELYYRQYAPEQIRANFAWRTTLGTKNASVCIIDGGIRQSHDDLFVNWASGYDFVNNDDIPEDNQTGHGTYMAGIAAGRIDNFVGIAGMGNVRLYGVKASDAGWYTQELVELAITWCADHALPPVVISMSFGNYTAPDPDNDAVKLAVQYAYNVKNNLLVASGGQVGGPSPTAIPYPAGYEEVIGVVATGPGSIPAPYSNHHSEVELVAPGTGIYSTNFTSDQGYGPFTSGTCEHEVCAPPSGLLGTSMSTAMVSGAAALFWDEYPQTTNVDLRMRLRNTAHPLLGPGWNEFTGYGEIDVKCLFDGLAWPCVSV